MLDPDDYCSLCGNLFLQFSVIQFLYGTVLKVAKFSYGQCCGASTNLLCSCSNLLVNCSKICMFWLHSKLDLAQASSCDLIFKARVV